MVDYSRFSDGELDKHRQQGMVPNAAGNGYDLAVQIVGGAGVSDAQESTLQDILDAAENQAELLAQTATELPKTPMMGATDSDAPILIDSTASGSRTIKAAVAGQATRVHAFEYQVSGACDVTIKVNGGAKYVRTYGSTGGRGGGVWRERPYFKTGVNEALTIETTNSVRLLATFETKTEA